jgi:hypothetical protein
MLNKAANVTSREIDMLRSLNATIQKLNDEVGRKIDSKLRELTDEERKGNKGITLLERLTVFSSLCQESKKYNLKYEELEEWLDKNSDNLTRPVLRSLDDEFSKGVKVMEPYVQETPTFEDLDTNFEKAKMLEDVTILQRLREHMAVVVNALKHYRTVLRDQFVAALRERTEVIFPSTGFNLFGLFGLNSAPVNENTKANEKTVMRLMSVLLNKLEEAPAVVPNENLVPAPATLKL